MEPGAALPGNIVQFGKNKDMLPNSCQHVKLGTEEEEEEEDYTLWCKIYV